MKNDTGAVEPARRDAPRGEIRYLFLPGRDLFAIRAGRFRHLSPGHPLEGYLSFLALLAEAQQEALDRFPAITLPNPDDPVRRHSQGLPLLDTRSLPRDPAWLQGLTTILGHMQASELPEAARETIFGLIHAKEADIEDTADRVLAMDLDAVPPQQLPFIASALQVYWVRMAALLDERTIARPEVPGICPVCGSPPVAGIVRCGGAEQGLRYLCCSLCASQWHLVRIRCSNCAITKGIDYFTLEGSNGAAKAESCEACGAYLKLLYLEKDGRMEPMADDLATFGLDMLMADKGRSRAGLNLFFHPGTV
jgi:FdhE protein